MSEIIKAGVIGSGLGGLAAAIRLQSSGIQTTIFEKRDLPGGRAYVYRDQGFTFDAGPTVITAPHCLEELFELSGRKLSDYVELLPVEPFYRLKWEDGYSFDYGSSLEETLNQIRKLSPDDEQGYLQFLDYSRRVFDEGYTKLVHVPFLNWWSMIRVSPQLMKLQAHRSVYAQVSKFIKDPHLRQAFSFHSLLVGGNPFDTSSIYTLIHFLERKWGVSYPRGGTGALVRALVKLFEDLGGRIYLNSEVDQIFETKGKISGILTQQGEKIDLDLVVSNADVMHTYAKLMMNIPAARQQTKKLEKMRYSMSLFLIYFGTKKQYPEMAHHTVCFGPRYRELLQEIFHEGTLAEDFSLYLHAPTRTDPQMAPEGCEAFYVLAPVPNMAKSQIDWASEGPKYADKILSYLEDRYLPDLKQNIVTQRIFTPADFAHELNAHQGSAFSLEPVLTQSAFFRTKNRDASIKGLYFVGAGTHPGAGVPGVVNSAKATVGLIHQDYSHV
jgi:phytoene desaturase